MACATLLRIATMCGVYYVNNVLKQDHPVLTPANVVGITYSNHVTLFNNMEFQPCFVNGSMPVLSQKSHDFFLNHDHPVIYNKDLVFYDVQKDDHLKLIHTMKENDRLMDQEEKRRARVVEELKDTAKDLKETKGDLATQRKRTIAEHEARVTAEESLADLRKKKKVNDAIKAQLLKKEKTRYMELENLMDQSQREAAEALKEERAKRLTLEKRLVVVKKDAEEDLKEQIKKYENERERRGIFETALERLQADKKKDEVEQSKRVEEEHEARVEAEEKLEQIAKRCKHRIRRMRRVVKRLREEDDDDEQQENQEQHGSNHTKEAEQEPIMRPTVAIREIVTPTPTVSTTRSAAQRAHEFSSFFPMVKKKLQPVSRNEPLKIEPKVSAIEPKVSAIEPKVSAIEPKVSAIEPVKRQVIQPRKNVITAEDKIKVLRELNTQADFKIKLPVRTVKAQEIAKKVQVKAQIKAKARVKEFITHQKDFAESEEGKAAREFCIKQGASGNSLKGCMQDMRLSGNKKIAARAVAFTNKAVRVNKKRNAETRTCTATGDPHFTNFNGDYFHLQAPAIFTLAKSSDGLFEVQALEDGKTARHKFSYMRRVKVNYDGKIYDAPFNQDGLSVSMSGNTVTISASVDYAGTLTGVCGDILPTKNTAAAFRLPSGAVADVDYKKRNWELSGYADTGKLTRWQQAWTPSRTNCLFSSTECNRYTK